MRTPPPPPSPPNAQRWARLALARLAAAVRRYLGMDLETDGSVRVHGTEERRGTVGMLRPFGPIAHHVQVLRDDPPALLRFYAAYAQACARLGRASESFDGQVEAFSRAIEAVPLPRPRLARVA